MQLKRNRFPGFALATLALAVSGFSVDAQADVVYSSLPTLGPSPTNVPSYGYEANQLSEVGDYVQLAAGGRALQSVTVTMSDFALAATYPALAAAGGYSQALTLNLYSYAGTGSAGALLGTDTTTTFVPFRPAEDATCPVSSGARGYRDSTNTCQNGVAFNVTFDFSGQGLVVPDAFVFGLAFNTQDYGTAPTGVAGPYNSLNFGAPTTGATIGTDVDPDVTFFRTGNGTFDPESGSSPNVVAAQFVTTAAVAVPEPSSIALMGLALASMAGVARRKRRSASK